MRLVGHPEVVDEPWFGDHNGRVENQALLDEYIGGWIAERDYDEVLAAFEAQQAVIGPIYSIADIFEDPQYAARETIATVDHPVLGPLRMQGVVPRLSITPGRITHPGAELGAHNEEIYGGLGVSGVELEELRHEGVI